MTGITVNGRTEDVHIDDETLLIDVLRNQLDLTGTKYSCGIAECGACTVLVNGEAMPSCVTPVSTVHGAEIVTIEGFSGPVADRLRQAWLDEDVPQCGFCQPGQILTAGELLSRIVVRNQVHDGIGSVFTKNPFDFGPITDVDLFERIPRARRNVLERIQITGVSQLVEIDDAGVGARLFEKFDEIGTYEPATTCN